MRAIGATIFSIMMPILTFGWIASMLGISALGLAHFIPFFFAVVVISSLMFFRVTEPIILLGFIGAWIELRWPWYAALLFAFPGFALMIPAFAGALGIGALAKFQRKRQP